MQIKTSLQVLTLQRETEKVAVIIFCRGSALDMLDAI